MGKEVIVARDKLWNLKLVMLLWCQVNEVSVEVISLFSAVRFQKWKVEEVEEVRLYSCYSVLL